MPKTSNLDNTINLIRLSYLCSMLIKYHIFLMPKCCLYVFLCFLLLKCEAAIESSEFIRQKLHLISDSTITFSLLNYFNPKILFEYATERSHFKTLLYISRVLYILGDAQLYSTCIDWVIIITNVSFSIRLHKNTFFSAFTQQDFFCFCRKMCT